MRYSIIRECWNEKTYNGYKDSPYWLINFNSYQIGLNDNGEIWSIINGVKITDFVIDTVKNIIKECKINLVIK